MDAKTTFSLEHKNFLDLGNGHFHTQRVSNQFLSSNLSNPRGRPREFDLDEALDKAIPIFCERGFHGTSITDLSDGMELAVGSIYKALKDKRGVFLAALDRQASVRTNSFRKAIDSVESGRAKVHAALLFYVALAQSPKGGKGCLMVSTATELATFDEEILKRARDSFDRREAGILELIRLGYQDGSIVNRGDSEGTARLMLYLIQGMIVVGKTGRSRKELMGVVDAAMKMLD